MPQKKYVGRTVSYVIIIVLTILLIFIFINSFSVSLNEKLEKQTAMYLREVTIQNAAQFDKQIEGDLRTLSLFASYVSTYEDIVSPPVLQLLDAAIGGSNFDRLGVAWAHDGLLYQTDSSVPEDISKRAVFQRALKGNGAVSQVRWSEYSDTETMLLLSPIIHDTETVGVIVATYNIDTLKKLANLTLFSGEGYSYIVDSDGLIMISSPHPQAVELQNNVFDLVLGSGGQNTESFQLLRPKMQKKEAGVLHYTYRNESKYLGYAPLSYNDWYLYCVIPDTIVTSQSNELSRLGSQLSAKIIILLMVVMLFISVVQYLNRKELQYRNDDLRMSEERYRIVLESSNDIFFDWNALDKVGYFSKRWREMFGEPAENMDYKTNPEVYAHIHPDDLDAYFQHMDNLFNSREVQTVEYRCKTLEGRYRWFQTRTTPIYSETDELKRVVGVFTDVTKEHEEKTHLLMLSKQDSLTKLYNKAATEELVNEYMGLSSNSSMGGFLIIDFDNFKDINDTMGHPFGDEVLRDVADGLRTIFRQTDILTRIGGDEYAVFIKDADSGLIMEKAGEILRLFQTLDEAKTACAVKIGCSIGVSLFPHDGATFRELYRKADLALYVAKKSGKGDYVLYNPSMEEKE